MSVTAFFLRNSHGVWALVVATILMGLAAYQEIPVRLFPDTAPPLVNVVTSWPGATAGDVERDLTDVLETEFAALEGVARTSTTSQDNLSTVQIEFQYGTDVRMAAVDVQNAVARIGEDLPPDAADPRVMTFSTADRPVYTVGVAADDLLVARRVAEDIVAPRLQAVSGVAAVDVFGGRVPSVIIEVDPDLSQAYHVPLGQVIGAVKTSNLSMPAGRVRSDTTETMLRIDNRAADVDAFEDITIPTPDGGLVRLGNVARVYRGADTDDALFRINGRRVIAVQVYRSEDANTVAVVRDVEARIAAMGKELTMVEFVAGEETATFTEQSVSNLLSNVWQALLLASLILFFFLGRARAALVTAFSMPLAFGLTFAAMWMMGMEFNMVTLSAVILAVGMVVDASVVVLENIIRLRDQGLSPTDAARQGTDEVLMPVLAGVATTLVVLIPLLALPGFIGRVFGPLALTLIIAFSSSVIVALVVVPILTLMVKDGGATENIAKVVAKPFQASMDILRRGYVGLLNLGLRFRWLVVLVAFASFAAGAYGLLAGGMNLLPRMDGGTFTVSLETPSGTPLAQTGRVVSKVEAILKSHPEVVLVQSQAGFEPGMKFAGGSGVMGSTQGFLSVNLSPRTERERTIWEIEADVREAINKVPGIANVVIKEVGNTAKPTTLAPVVARISGPDTRVLDVLGGDVADALREVDSIVDPTRSWRRDMKRVLVDIDVERAAKLGQTPQSIGQLLVMGAEGVDAGDWTNEDGATEPIEVRYKKDADANENAMLAWPIFMSNGDIVPIRSVTKTVTSVEQGLYNSIDLNPVLDIRAQVDGRPLNFVVADAKLAVAELKMPAGYEVVIEGENKDLEESRTSILKALILSILAVYLLLVAQFRSWKYPLTVMMALPLSLSGVSLALFLVEKPVSMPVMVGLVLLVGTVVNNSILLVDLIRQRHEGGASRHDALREAVSSRFRPIMMTSMSTVIGMLPLAMELALGSERFSPLAVAVIGGMLASTLLTMIVIPVLYDISDSLRWPGKKAAASAALIAVTVLAVLVPQAAQAQTMTLEQAWELVQNHPVVEAQEKRLEAAKSRSSAATGRMGPTIELQARATLLSEVEPPLIEIPLTLPDGSTPDAVPFGELITEQYALGVSLTQPVFVGGQLYYGRQAAFAKVDAAEAGTERVLSSQWLRLVTAWYSAAALREMVVIQTEVVKAARGREASLSRLIQGGRGTELQLAEVSLRRGEAEQRLAETQSAAVNAEQALASLVGRPVDQGPVDVVAAAHAAKSTPEYRIGPGIRQVEALSKAAESGAKAKTGALLPTVALRFGAQYANPNTRYFPPKSVWNGTWDASVVLTWTLDSGVRWNESEAAEFDAATARANVEALKRQAALEYDQAVAVLEVSAIRLEVAAERVTVAQAAVKATEFALERGRATPLDVMDRERDLSLALASQQKVALEIVSQAEKARVLAGEFGFAH